MTLDHTEVQHIAGTVAHQFQEAWREKYREDYHETAEDRRDLFEAVKEGRFRNVDIRKWAVNALRYYEGTTWGASIRGAIRHMNAILVLDVKGSDDPGRYRRHEEALQRFYEKHGYSTDDALMEAYSNPTQFEELLAVGRHLQERHPGSSFLEAKLGPMKERGRR